jgi:hypothetical protein
MSAHHGASVRLVEPPCGEGCRTRRPGIAPRQGRQAERRRLAIISGQPHPVRRDDALARPAGVVVILKELGP